MDKNTKKLIQDVLGDTNIYFLDDKGNAPKDLKDENEEDSNMTTAAQNMTLRQEIANIVAVLVENGEMFSSGDIIGSLADRDSHRWQDISREIRSVMSEVIGVTGRIHVDGILMDVPLFYESSLVSDTPFHAPNGVFVYHPDTEDPENYSFPDMNSSDDDDDENDEIHCDVTVSIVNTRVAIVVEADSDDADYLTQALGEALDNYNLRDKSSSYSFEISVNGRDIDINNWEDDINSLFRVQSDNVTVGLDDFEEVSSLTIEKDGRVRMKADTVGAIREKGVATIVFDENSKKFNVLVPV